MIRLWNSIGRTISGSRYPDVRDDELQRQLSSCAIETYAPVEIGHA